MFEILGSGLGNFNFLGTGIMLPILALILGISKLISNDSMETFLLSFATLSMGCAILIFIQTQNAVYLYLTAVAIFFALIFPDGTRDLIFKKKGT